MDRRRVRRALDKLLDDDASGSSSASDDGIDPLDREADCIRRDLRLISGRFSKWAGPGTTNRCRSEAVSPHYQIPSLVMLAGEFTGEHQNESPSCQPTYGMCPPQCRCHRVGELHPAPEKPRCPPQGARNRLNMNRPSATPNLHDSPARVCLAHLWSDDDSEVTCPGRTNHPIPYGSRTCTVASLEG